MGGCFMGQAGLKPALYLKMTLNSTLLSLCLLSGGITGVYHLNSAGDRTQASHTLGKHSTT